MNCALACTQIQMPHPASRQDKSGFMWIVFLFLSTGREKPPKLWGLGLQGCIPTVSPSSQAGFSLQHPCC